MAAENCFILVSSAFEGTFVLIQPAFLDVCEGAIYSSLHWQKQVCHLGNIISFLFSFSEIPFQLDILDWCSWLFFFPKLKSFLFQFVGNFLPFHYFSSFFPSFPFSHLSFISYVLLIWSLDFMLDFPQLFSKLWLSVQIKE